jgi:hypothetical protein
MKFKFEIEAIFEVLPGRVFSLEGLLHEGVILGGSDANIQELGLPIKIKSVALVNPPDKDRRRLTLNIERPDISLDKIKSGMLLYG